MVFMSCDDVSVQDFAVDLDELAKRLRLNRKDMRINAVFQSQPQPTRQKSEESFSLRKGNFEIYLPKHDATVSSVTDLSKGINPYNLNDNLNHKRAINDLYSERVGEKTQDDRCNADVTDSDGLNSFGLLDLYHERLMRRKQK